MTTTAAQDLQTETVSLIPVAECHKSPSQPRRRGGDKKPDDDFVASIREKGVIQPIVVRDREAGGWEVVFGHRRWEGSKLAGRDGIPAIVRDLTDEQVFELQLIENVHRQDMHPLDEADGFRRMMEKGKKTAAEIAAAIGRSIPAAGAADGRAAGARDRRTAFACGGTAAANRNALHQLPRQARRLPVLSV